MVHYVQGGYFIKNFGKHGELHNSTPSSYFDSRPPRQLLAAGMSRKMESSIKAAHFKVDGSWITRAFARQSNRLEHAYHLLGSILQNQHQRRAAGFYPDKLISGRWICCTGSDGALYIADWYDKRANHVIAVDDWEKDTGRI